MNQLAHLTICLVTLALVSIPTEAQSISECYHQIRIPAAHYSANQFIKPHKPVYFTLTYSADHKKFNYFKKFKEHRALENLQFNPIETSFQLGGKALIATCNRLSVYSAFNLEANWQCFVQDPYFRSMDHHIELFFDYPFMWHGLDLHARAGHVHQSNGLGLNILHSEKHNLNNWSLEKGWDRLYGSLKYNHNRKFSVLLKLWHVIVTHKLFEVGKYNPDIADFLGNGKLTLIWRFNAKHSITIGKRLLDKQSNYGLSLKSSWNLSYLFPVPGLVGVQGIVKAHSGYGRNMITYNTNTIGASFGFAFFFDEELY